MTTIFEYLLAGTCQAPQLPELLNILRGMSTSAPDETRWTEQVFKHEANQALEIRESTAILRTTLSKGAKTTLLRYVGNPQATEKPITMRASIEVKVSGRVAPALQLMGFKLQQENHRSGHIFKTMKGMTVTVFRNLRSEPGKPLEAALEPDPSTPYQVVLSGTGPAGGGAGKEGQGQGQAQLADEVLAFSEFLKPHADLARLVPGRSY
eukprot:tig00000615_g2556.t1